jgi:hypothetical protein
MGIFPEKNRRHGRATENQYWFTILVTRRTPVNRNVLCDVSSVMRENGAGSRVYFASDNCTRGIIRAPKYGVFIAYEGLYDIQLE